MGSVNEKSYKLASYPFFYLIPRRHDLIWYLFLKTWMAESEEELKHLLMKVKEESKKAGWKLNIQKTKIMASGPITLWQIDGEKNSNSDRLFSWVSKSLWMVTAAMKLNCLFLGRQAVTKSRQCIKKQRHHFANKHPDTQIWFFQ